MECSQIYVWTRSDGRMERSGSTGFFQGVGKRDEYVHGQIIYLSGGFKHIQKDRWDPARSVEDNLKYAKYPRLTDGQGNNYEMSTFGNIMLLI